jgi:hypothetical protein
MKAFNYLTRSLVTAMLIGCLAIGATGKGGGGGGNQGNGGGGHGGGGSMGSGGRGSSGAMRGGGSPHMSQGQSSPRVADRPSFGSPPSQPATSRPQFSGQSSSRTADQSSAGRAQNQSDAHQSFFRGPESGSQSVDRGQGSDRERVNASPNGRGDNRGREGDFRQRFSDRDRFDRNGDNFRHNADSIRRDFRHRDRDDLPFRFGWWDNHRFDHGFGPWGYTWWEDRPWYWWGWTTAPILDSWLAFGWERPCYWDYGLNGYIYYQDNQFYQNGQPYQSANNYYRQVYDLAHSAPSIAQDEAAKMEWMPLGVFAVSREGQQDEDRLIQIAVNKQGVLSGTYYNKINNGAHPLVGMVDQKTQRAAWYFADGTYDQMVFETSIHNLTEPQSTIMVHFAPGNVGVWQLVRLERPEESLPQQDGQQQSLP